VLIFILAIFAVVDVGFFSGEWGGGGKCRSVPFPRKEFDEFGALKWHIFVHSGALL